MTRWPLGLYRVSGVSMSPTYRDGDMLLGSRWFRLRVGQIVVADNERMLIKRIEKIDDSGVWLTGDNPEFSTDSREFGPLDRRLIKAVILFRIAQGAQYR